MVPQIPDVPIPEPPDPWQDPVAYLRSIHAVRERSRLVLEKAKRNQLRHFEVDMSKFPETASYVVSIIKVRTSHTLFVSCMHLVPACTAQHGGVLE